MPRLRAKMILYAADGATTAEIARRLETAPRVVGRWRKRFFEDNLVRQRVTGDAALQLGTLLATQLDHVSAISARFDACAAVPSTITDRTSGHVY